MTWEPKVRIISISVAIPICIEHVLTPFQIISRFVFSKYIDFAMHFDIYYVLAHRKTMDLKKSK